jgi:hypothetical protein
MSFSPVLDSRCGLDICAGEIFADALCELMLEQQRYLNEIQWKFQQSACTHPQCVDVALSAQRALASLRHLCFSNSKFQSSADPACPMEVNGTVIPGISLQNYVQRIASNSCASEAAYVLAFSYIRKLALPSATGAFEAHVPTVLVNAFTVHRLALVAVLVAGKFADDEFFNNAHYAAVGGLQLDSVSPKGKAGSRELNALEVEFLRLLGFGLYTSPGEYDMAKGRMKTACWMLRCRSVSAWTLPTIAFMEARCAEVAYSHAMYCADRANVQVQVASPTGVNQQGEDSCSTPARTLTFSPCVFVAAS